MRASPRCCTQFCGQRPRTHPRQSGGFGANRTLHPRALHEARQRHLAGSCHGYRGQLAACPHAAPLGHHTPFFTLSRRSVGSRRGSTACPCCKAPPVRQQRASSRHRSGRKDAARSHRDAPAPGCREPDRAQMASTQRPAPEALRGLAQATFAACDVQLQQHGRQGRVPGSAETQQRLLRLPEASANASQAAPAT